MTDTTGAGQPTANRPVEERLRVLEQVVTLIADRQAEIARLTDATQSLSKSATGLDNTLSNVGKAMTLAQEAKLQSQAAADTADTTAVALVASESRYRRRTRTYALLAILISLTAVVTLAVYARTTRNRFQDFQTAAYQRCETRLAYDQANHLSVGADITELESQLAQTSANRTQVHTLIRSFPPGQRAGLRASEHAAHMALLDDLATKQAAYAAGIPGSCQQLK